jgi:hypothetical protein
MNKSLLLGTITLVLLALAVSAHAQRIPDELAARLPVSNVYDPIDGRNQPITYYSYDQLARMMTSASFRQWNDEEKVCRSIEIIYGRAPVSCGGYGVGTYPQSIFTPGTARAYVSFQILPPPPVEPPVGVKQVLLVDPVYPPWSPTYDPYW